MDLFFTEILGIKFRYCLARQEEYAPYQNEYIKISDLIAWKPNQIAHYKTCA